MTEFPHFKGKTEFDGPQHAADPILQNPIDPYNQPLTGATVNDDDFTKRKFPWIFAGVQFVFAVWLVVAWIKSMGADDHCVSTPSPFGGSLGSSLNDLCTTAASAGSAVALAAIVGLWVAVTVILGTTYIVFKGRWA